MTSARVVELATEYLDQCIREDRLATLAGMYGYIDARNKTLPLLEEVNEALTKRPSVFVQRVDGAIVFASSGLGRAVTSEDMKRADKQYRKEFSVILKKLGE